MPQRSAPVRRANLALLAALSALSLPAAAQTAADVSEANRNLSRIQREQEERQRADLQQTLEAAGRQGKLVVPQAPHREAPARRS
jgi:hypothetical protein